MFQELKQNSEVVPYLRLSYEKIMNSLFELFVVAIVTFVILWIIGQLIVGSYGQFGGFLQAIGSALLWVAPVGVLVFMLSRLGLRIYRHNLRGFWLIARVDAETGEPRITHVSSLPIQNIFTLLLVNPDSQTKLILPTTSAQSAFALFELAGNPGNHKQTPFNARVVPDGENEFDIEVTAKQDKLWIKVSLSQLYTNWNVFSESWSLSEVVGKFFHSQKTLRTRENALEKERVISVAWQARFEVLLRMTLGLLDVLSDSGITRPSDEVRDMRIAVAQVLNALLSQIPDAGWLKGVVVPYTETSPVAPTGGTTRDLLLGCTSLSECYPRGIELPALLTAAFLKSTLSGNTNGTSANTGT